MRLELHQGRDGVFHRNTHPGKRLRCPSRQGIAETLEGEPTGEATVEQDPYRPEIAAFIDRGWTLDLLRCHVLWCAESTLRQRGIDIGSGDQAEICEQRPATGEELPVVRR